MQDNSATGLPLITGKVEKPQRVVIYGPEGIGKSTLAAAFPEPVFLDTEGGTIHLNVTRFAQPQNWEDILDLIVQLGQSDHHFQTLVIDTVDWLERLLIEHICRKSHKDGIEDFGYGKGYTYLSEEFSRFLQSLEALRSRGMHLVMVAHSTIRKFEQPDAAGAYDRYELKLSKQCAPLIKEWCDLLLFVNYFTKVTETDGRKKAVGGKERRIYTAHCAAFDAKNRHGLDDVLPMEFEAIAHVFLATGTLPAPSATPSTPPASGKPATQQQIKNIQGLWQQLGCGQEQMAKLFQWLDAEALEGAESWDDLTMEQAARAISFLSKKVSEGGVA
ncbi:ATP-binding protein [Ruficoccus amylovorans]|uniref:ATP-binding protein n=1 Tax=Ruficoccus amylovorans TaxID=1804625 RepID=A0A842H9L7_9BACT|nr:ATP-binding protein [Ruficoccus amylovorans]MBC2592819.1 ATP-binding protein [Ruficoccus amylovorans]